MANGPGGNMKATIVATDFYLPSHIVSNETVARGSEEWTPEKIFDKTGVQQRHIASAEECSSDLAVRACEKLFASAPCRPEDIDFILLCTQSPDYFLPTTACLLQHRLGIPSTAGALDFNLGCSGYVYGLGLAKGLIETGQARRILLVTAETYSKFINEGDRSVRSIFGDAAAATLVTGVESDSPGEFIGPFVYGTDGSGAENLIVPVGGMRTRTVIETEPVSDRFGNKRTSKDLYMNGAEIFTFTLRSVPRAVQTLMEKAHCSLDDVDVVVFHQANKYMLDHLRKKMCISEEKFVIALSDSGNTVSATIPIALTEAARKGRLKNGDRVLLVGFGVGYSWGAALIQWRGGLGQS
jgi:3-oxoacyl-[acyl-carrier-protein] synthase-3